MEEYKELVLVFLKYKMLLFYISDHFQVVQLYQIQNHF